MEVSFPLRGVVRQVVNLKAPPMSAVRAPFRTNWYIFRISRSRIPPNTALVTYYIQFERKVRQFYSLLLIEAYFEKAKQVNVTLTGKQIENNAENSYQFSGACAQFTLSIEKRENREPCQLSVHSLATHIVPL